MENTDLVGGITLKDLIKKSGFTQRELAKRTGIKEVTINKWVAGRYTPSLDNVVIVARELKVNLKTICESLGLDVSKIPD